MRELGLLLLKVESGWLSGFVFKPRLERLHYICDLHEDDPEGMADLMREIEDEVNAKQGIYWRMVNGECK